MSTREATAITRELAERSAALAFRDLPEDVVEIARQALLDWFGVTLGGAAEEAPELLLQTLPASGPDDARAASIVGRESRLAPLDAALVNGTASHALDFDDVNLAFLGHASVAILGAALALAEQLDVDSSALITAYVAGYETICAAAVALGPEPYIRGFHATGTIGTLGAAAACARLLGLDAEQTAVATGIAASQAAGLKCNLGTMTKPLHAGRACQGGLLAALLAARGFSANPDAIEADQGLAAALGGHREAAEPAGSWHLRENLFKYHASCFFTHSAIEGVLELKGRGLVAPDDLEQLVIHVGELELGTCVIPEPQTGLEVKFSIAHLAAMALLGRSTSVISDEAAGDAEVIALRSRIALEPDAEPGEATRVDGVLRDGSTVTARHDVSQPQRDLLEQRRRLSEKYGALADPVLGSRRAAGLLDVVLGLAPGDSVRGLMRLARPSV